MKKIPRVPALAAVTLTGSLLLLGACQPRDTADEVVVEQNQMVERDAGPGLGLPPPAASPYPQEVQVTLADGEIQMPVTLPAGLVTLTVRNAGTREHSLEIEGQGIEVELEPHLQPGQSATLEVELRPGSYRVYCPVGDHAEQGMELQLEVTATNTAP